ncbi:MAG: hypothetical protein WCX64_01785 [Candidatus Micrarchaeia archaeon]
MNALTLVVLGVVAWLFFLSGSSFLFLLSLVVLVLYCLVEVGGSREHEHHHHEQAGRSGDPGGSGKAMEDAAGTLGNLVNVVGSIFGKFFVWAFKGEKK